MNDIINGSFQLIGGIICWLNVMRLLKDKQIKGISWSVQAFFMLWGYWNLYYYPSLNQTMSFIGGIILVIANTAWVVLTIKYSRKNK